MLCPPHYHGRAGEFESHPPDHFPLLKHCLKAQRCDGALYRTD